MLYSRLNLPHFSLRECKKKKGTKYFSFFPFFLFFLNLFSTEEHQNYMYLPLGRDGIESILIHKNLGCFLPENPERVGSSQFKSTLANSGGAAPSQLPEMVIPREFLLLASEEIEY